MFQSLIATSTRSTSSGSARGSARRSTTTTDRASRSALALGTSSARSRCASARAGATAAGGTTTSGTTCLGVLGLHLVCVHHGERSVRQLNSHTNARDVADNLGLLPPSLGADPNH